MRYITISALMCLLITVIRTYLQILYLFGKLTYEIEQKET